MDVQIQKKKYNHSKKQQRTGDLCGSDTRLWHQLQVLREEESLSTEK